MKVSKKFLTLLALPVFSVAMAQNAPIPTMAPGAKQIQNAPKTMEEALKFLPETVMTVDGKKVTKADVIAILKNAVPEQFIGQVPQAQLKQMVSEVLNMKIMEALADKAGYKPSEAAVRAELEKQLNSLTPEQKKQVEERMKAAGKTIKSFTEEMAKNKEAQRNQANMKWISEKIAPTVKVTEEDALKFYNENKARFVTPETITASHILIQPEKAGDKASEQKAEAKAKAILAQIKQGADFGTLAQTDSACPSGKRAKGSLGKMTKDGLDQDFWKAAFALKKGEISGVVKTQFGYHIIRLEDKEVGTQIKYQDLKAKILDHLKEMGIAKKVSEAVENAKKNGFVKVNKF